MNNRVRNGTKLVMSSVQTLIQTGLTLTRLQIPYELERMGASLDKRVQRPCVFETDVISFSIRPSSGTWGGGIGSEPVSFTPY
jgi:hypothetical protein